MKKIIGIILLSSLLSAITNSMEQLSDPTSTEYSPFSHLPIELRAHIFSFIPEATSMKEIFNKIANLALVDSTFTSVAMIPVLIKEAARRFVSLYPDSAYAEFFDAVEHDNEKIVKALLDGGVNVNKLSVKTSALHIAVKHGNLAMVKLLLSYKADPGINSEYKPLLRITNFSQTATAENIPAIARLLIEHGDNVNSTDFRGETPLLCAAKIGFYELAKVLLEMNADVNAAIHSGRTPLHAAAYKGAYTVADLLLTFGAYVHAQNINGTTPLMIASRDGHEEIVARLIEADADVNARDDTGDTCLSEALRKYNYADRIGDTAAKQALENIIRLLRKHGAVD